MFPVSTCIRGRHNLWYTFIMCLHFFLGHCQLFCLHIYFFLWYAFFLYLCLFATITISCSLFSFACHIVITRLLLGNRTCTAVFSMIDGCSVARTCRLRLVPIIWRLCFLRSLRTPLNNTLTRHHVMKCTTCT